MKIKVLGAHNVVSRTTRPVSLLVDGVLALDAGSLASGLSFRAQAKVKDLLITHAHYDHIRDVPAFAMNLFLRGKTVNIYCGQAVKDMLLSHLMDGTIYPDFTRRPPDTPTVRFTIVTPGQPVLLDGYAVKPVPVRHALPATGFEVTSPDGKRVFYTGDTGPGLSEAWQQTRPDLLIIEVTTSNRYESAVRDSLHLTPGLLHAELLAFRGLHDYLPRVLTVHMNPNLESDVHAELESVAASLSTEITPAREGMVLRV